MKAVEIGNPILAPDDLILVTGAAGFIGRRVVHALLSRGYTNLRCLVRFSSRTGELEHVLADYGSSNVEIMRGNLLSAQDCTAAVRDAKVVYHVAAGRGEK